MPTLYMNSAGRASLQLGRGVDSLTGTPLGVAVIPDQPQIDSNNSGQIVNYDVSIIESSEELEESMGLSIGAEMRYGLFSASGKFEMKEKAQYKSFATYVLAKCDVRNPPVGLFDPGAKEEARRIRDIATNFSRAYGDCFVRSALTGGEFYVVIEIVHQDRNVQKSLAASLQAEYNGFIAGGAIDVQMSVETKQKASSSLLRIIQYQAAGTGVTTNLVSNADQAMTRLKAFPQIVKDNPVSIQVELASYDTIPQLQPNIVRRENLKEWLNECARKRAAYKQTIDELDFLLTGQNRQFFTEPPEDDLAQEWRRIYTRAWNKVMAHAASLAEGEATSGFEEPEGLPVVRLKRVEPVLEATEVDVPQVENLPLASAQQLLSAIGLCPVPAARTVPASDMTTPRSVVLSQSPPASAKLPQGANVRLDYAVTEGRFKLRLDIADQRQLVSKVAVAR